MRRVFLFLFFSIMITVSSSPLLTLPTEDFNHPNQQFKTTEYPTDLSSTKVAVFKGSELEVSVESRIALYNMFRWMNASVDYVNSSQIAEGGLLWEYDILAVPDGLAPTFEFHLGESGIEVIREWVSRGGAYFGVRAGATLACSYSYFEGVNEEYDLKIFNGTGYGPLIELGEMSITNISINTTALPSFSNEPSELQVLYRASRYFNASESQEVIPIGRYAFNNGLGMLAFHYGTGCGFISALSPEFEENSDRDGTDFRDSLDDPDSEWPLMLDICKWLVDESIWNLPPTTTTTNLTETTNTTTSITTVTQSIPMDMLLLGGGLGAVVIIATLIVVLKKR